MKKIRIAIDAKWYFEGPPSGRVVVKNIVDYFNHSDEHDIVFFIDRKFKNAPELIDFKGKIVFVWAGNNMLSNVFILPFLSLYHHVDAILYQNFPSFIFWKRQIAYVHDIIYMTSPEFYTLAERIYFSPLKYLVKFASDIVTVSEFEKNRMIANGFGKEKPFHVVYHGVDSAFMPIEKHNSEKNELVKQKHKLPQKYILFVGRLNVRKNITNLLKAFKLVLEKRTDYKLVVVGSKDWKSLDIDGLVKQLNISDHIIFTGGIYGDELPVVYAGATVFCFPSYDESFGLPPLEAMASGVPVVASNRASLPEICGNCALYADPDDASGISNQILTLLDNSELREEMAKKGIERASEFTWTRSVKSIRSIFGV